MNLQPPPKTGNTELDIWLNELYSFLKFPVFHAVKLVPRTAPTTTEATTEGVIYQDSSDNKLKGHNGTAFQDCY